MILLNSWITWLEKIHLTYQFFNAFFDRILWAMLNLWDVFSWRGGVKYLSKFDIRISYVFIRTISLLFFEAVSCTKDVEHKWKKVEHEWK